MNRVLHPERLVLLVGLSFTLLLLDCPGNLELPEWFEQDARVGTLEPEKVALFGSKRLHSFNML